ncbi:MAG TPA: DUF3463 domain-containing protein [Anaerolineae bacterium]|nr:DUF3463 domain-containing protein [Anaerolineae bacterium]HQM14484.1 DUF3463 domain-containing protein [Anaerolineae bacterium]
MRVFVTGGTGFIGSAVVRCLLAAGHEVRTLVRSGSDTRQLDGLPVERVPGDLNTESALARGLAGCEWVFHVAHWEAYGAGHDPRCANCMVHSGHDAAAMNAALSSPSALWRLIRWALS